jgi:site-specific DNA recombinase
MTGAGIIYLRLSDFRDEDDESTFAAREDELRGLADEIGLAGVSVVTENDLRADGRPRSASAYKTPLEVVTAGGVMTRRTNRPRFTEVLRALQEKRASVLIAGDESRISRDWRDAADLLDVVRASGGSVVVPGEDGPVFLLTDGGTRAERAAFRDRINDAAKFSDQLASKITRGRKRWAGKSYFGGKRPFGYVHDPAAAEHRKRLIVVEPEAAELRKGAAALLNGVSLKAVVRDLKARGVGTVTGVPWTASTLRDVLSKRSLSGVIDPRGEVVIPRILDDDAVERLAALFDANTAKQTDKSNEPRWLLSGIAVCGGCGSVVKCSGSADRRAYVCSRLAEAGPEVRHVRRNAEQTDLVVAARVVALIEREGGDFLRPRPKANADTAALRAELRRLALKRDDLARLLSEDVLTESGVRAERKRLDERTAAVALGLADSAEADPLPEFRDADAGALAVWDGLGLARQRAVLRALYVVTILPAERKGSTFDPDSIGMERTA